MRTKFVRNLAALAAALATLALSAACSPANSPAGEPAPASPAGTAASAGAIDLGLSDITPEDVSRVIFTKNRGGAFMWDSAERGIISDALGWLKSAAGTYAPDKTGGGGMGISFVLTDGSETGSVTIANSLIVCNDPERGQLPYVADNPRPMEEWDAIIGKCDVMYVPPR